MAFPPGLPANQHLKPETVWQTKATGDSPSMILDDHPQYSQVLRK